MNFDIEVGASFAEGGMSSLWYNPELKVSRISVE